MADVPRTCSVPGCGRRFGRENTSGVCRSHNHLRPYCQCSACAGRPARRSMPTNPDGRRERPPVSLAPLPWQDREGEA